MRKLDGCILSAILALIAAFQVFGQARISPLDAAKNVGKEATVCGLVTSVNYVESRKGSPTFLNLDRSYPEQVFTVVIWGKDRAKFPKPPDIRYAGEKICVTGTITLTRKVAEIVVTEPSQITRHE